MTGVNNCCPCEEGKEVKEDRKEGGQTIITDVDGGHEDRLFFDKVCNLIIIKYSASSFLSDSVFTLNAIRYAAIRNTQFFLF